MTRPDSVDARHPEYTVAAPLWTRCRDVHGGADAVKAAGRAYLPQLSNQTWADYEAYKARALFAPMMARTVAGLRGLVLRKPPAVRVPRAIAADLLDLTGADAGDTLPRVAAGLLTELLVTGRVGIMVDWADDLGRPVWEVLVAERLTNWRTGGRGQLEQAVTHDPVEVRVGEFGRAVQDQYRVWSLDADTGELTVGTWQRRRIEGLPHWELTGLARPLRRGRPLGGIPIVVVGPEGVGADVAKPPLLDLADVNLSHYRSGADLEHGRHFTALPTAWVAGAPPNTTALTIGSSQAWLLPSGAQAGFLEFSGAGLAALEKALEHKERLMAILGARLLEGEPRRNETAEAVRLRHAGEHATLRSIASAVGAALTDALRWHAFWVGDAGEDAVAVQMASDFVEQRLAPAEMQALLSLWQSGGVAWPTLYGLLEKAEITRPGVTAAQELAQIRAEDALIGAEGALDGASGE